MTTKKGLQQLIKDFPPANLLLSEAEQTNKQLYDKYIACINLLTTAIELDDVELFDKASSEYKSIYQQFCDQGLNIVINQSLQANKKTTAIKKRIVDKTNRKGQLQREYEKVMKAADILIKKMKKIDTEILKEKEMLKNV